MPIDWSQQPLRSFLLIPGVDMEKLRAAGTFGADAVVLDLEDTVAATMKDQARANVRSVLASGIDAVVFVRVNDVSSGLIEDDIKAVVTVGLDGLHLPMVEDIDDVLHVDRLLSRAEAENGLPEGTVRLHVRFETAKGLSKSEQILAAAPARTLLCGVGLGDFTNDIGTSFDVSSEQVTAARCRIVVAARAAGLLAPIDSSFPNLNDEGGLAEDVARSRRIGLQGRLALNTHQIETINKGYSELSVEDRRHAENVIRDFEAAEANGIASLHVDGQFVDYIVYHQAKRKLSLEKKLKAVSNG